MNAVSRVCPEEKKSQGFSRSIDIGRLERETRPFLMTGILCGILLGALFSRVHMPVDRKHPRIAGTHDAIQVRLVEIPARKNAPPHGAPPVQTIPRPVAETAPLPPGEEMLATADTSGTFPAVTSRGILRMAPDMIPDFGAKPDSLMKRKKAPDRTQEVREREFLALSEKFGNVSPKRRDTVFEAEKSPVDRGFTRFGVGIPVSNPLSSKKRTAQAARRSGDSAGVVVGAYRKTSEQVLLEKMKKEQFSSLTERDVRFLILMWRDTYFDAAKLSLNDRSFLDRHSPDTPISYSTYLQSMGQRGIVKPVAVDGRIIYKALLTRRELLQALSQAVEEIVNSPREADWLVLVSLVGSCYDFTQNRIILPE